MDTSVPTAVDDTVSLADSACAGDRSALARLLTLVENGGDVARDALAALPSRDPRRAATVGITGAPGAGKSTLTDRLVSALRATGATVGVLAVDPSSPFSGGAILGDRIRMAGHETDPGVFVRSMATRGHLGGLARSTPQAVRVLEATGFDWVLVETVGVGQVEIEVAGAADTTIVVLTPGTGDGVQATKAGLMEIADVFAVNKADRDGVAATLRDVRAVLTLAEGRGWTPPVVETVASAGQGTEELLAAVLAHREHLSKSGEMTTRRARRAADEVRALVVEAALARAGTACAGADFATVSARVARGELDPYTAATLLEGADTEGAP
jgi:LAO/AO transport system kinase